MSAAPSTIGFNETSFVTVIARNADGSLYGPGGLVTLRTSLGKFRGLDTELQLMTDEDSQVTVRLEADQEPGTATVRAVLGSSAEVTTDVVIENQRPNLLISVLNDVIPVLGSTEVTVIARDNNDVPLGSGNRIRMTSTLGVLDNEEPLTDANGEATVTYTAFNRAGMGEVRAFLGTSAEVSAQITIRDAPASLDFQADPGTVQGGQDAVINLTATVLNAQGDPVAAASVTFGTATAGVGGSFMSGSNLSTTDTQGRATDTLTIPENEISGLNSFVVTAVVRGEGAEIEERITINVNN